MLIYLSYIVNGNSIFIFLLYNFYIPYECLFNQKSQRSVGPAVHEIGGETLENSKIGGDDDSISPGGLPEGLPKGLPERPVVGSLLFHNECDNSSVMVYE
jgi:hypothetical protein